MSVYEFGPFLLDSERLLLLDRGEPVALGPKVVETLLALVEPAGPACHTGERTCFHRGELEPSAPSEVLAQLERTIAKRAAERPSGSYTVELLDDPARLQGKVMEEAEEVDPPMEKDKGNGQD